MPTDRLQSNLCILNNLITHRAIGSFSALLCIRRSILCAVAGFVILSSVGCQTMTTSARINRGTDAYKQGRYDDAAVALSSAVEQSPTSWKAQYMLGLTRLKQGFYFQARTALERAWVLRSESSESRYIVDALAEATLLQGEYDSLYATLDRACRIYGRGYDYLRKAIYLKHAGDMDNAALAFEKASQLMPPDDNRAFVEAANFYLEMGETEREILALRRAYYINPNDLEVANRLRRHGIVPGPTIGLPIN